MKTDKLLEKVEKLHRRKRINEICKTMDQEKAEQTMLDESLAVSRSEVRRIYQQKTGNNN